MLLLQQMSHYRVPRSFRNFMHIQFTGMPLGPEDPRAVAFGRRPLLEVYGINRRRKKRRRQHHNNVRTPFWRLMSKVARSYKVNGLRS